MRVVIAPDKFKGYASAREMAERLADACTRVSPRSDIVVIPMADGGEGSIEALAPVATQVETYTVEDAWGEPCDASVLFSNDGAWVEMAQTAGTGSRRGPAAALTASTRGTGLLLQRLRDADRLFIAVGGTLSSDGGCGLAGALGWSFLDAAGREIPPGGRGLEELDRIIAPDALAQDFVGACDVMAPLHGARGAARCYAPQKGADPEGVGLLERGLEHLTEIVRRDLGRDPQDHAGAGSGGGTGYGLAAFFDASLERGFDLIAERVGLDEAVASSDLVITGEGAFDEQSLEGKTAMGVLGSANRHGVPCALVAGRIEAKPREGGFLVSTDLREGEEAAVELVLRAL